MIEYMYIFITSMQLLFALLFILFLVDKFSFRFRFIAVTL